MSSYQREYRFVIWSSTERQHVFQIEKLPMPEPFLKIEALTKNVKFFSPKNWRLEDMIPYKVPLRHPYSLSPKNLGTEVNKKNWKLGQIFNFTLIWRRCSWEQVCEAREWFKLIKKQVLEIATGRKELREGKQQLGAWEVGGQLIDVHDVLEPGEILSSTWAQAFTEHLPVPGHVRDARGIKIETPYPPGLDAQP